MAVLDAPRLRGLQRVLQDPSPGDPCPRYRVDAAGTTLSSVRGPLGPVSGFVHEAITLPWPGGSNASVAVDR
jgi:hypothetical protein